jgi:hypothetical protein
LHHRSIASRDSAAACEDRFLHIKVWSRCGRWCAPTFIAGIPARKPARSRRIHGQHRPSPAVAADEDERHASGAGFGVTMKHSSKKALTDSGAPLWLRGLPRLKPQAAGHTEWLSLVSTACAIAKPLRHVRCPRFRRAARAFWLEGHGCVAREA